MKLNLKRPIVVFDLETTGLEVARDHIVELCYIKLHPDGNEESMNLRIRPVDATGRTVPIPPASTEIHGITDADVAQCPTFKELAPRLAETFADCDFAGFNSNKFDVPLLVEEFLRAGINIDLRDRKFIDVQNIYHKLEPRTLSAACRFYCGHDIEGAHSADADARATLEVLEAQLDHYPQDLQNDVGFLAEFSAMNQNVDFAGRIIKDKSGDYVINFGKYKGKKLADVLRRDRAYLPWIMQGDFPLNTKQTFERLALMLLQPKQPAQNT